MSRYSVGWRRVARGATARRRRPLVETMQLPFPEFWARRFCSRSSGGTVEPRRETTVWLEQLTVARRPAFGGKWQEGMGAPVEIRLPRVVVERDP